MADFPIYCHIMYDAVMNKDGTLRLTCTDVSDHDFVEVVRCKDCKWCHSGYCERFDDLIPFGLNTIEWENWFCADGERRVDNG